jgi:hypothetical protein
VLDEFLIDIHSIGQQHISKRTPVLIVAVRLERDFFSKGEGRGRVLGVVAVGLAFLWAVDAVEADAFRLLVVQDFEGVAVEDGDDGACLLLLRHDLVFDPHVGRSEESLCRRWFESTILVDPSLGLPEGNAIGLFTTLADFS